jgi:hypothetical protein
MGPQLIWHCVAVEAACGNPRQGQLARAVDQ